LRAIGAASQARQLTLSRVALVDGVYELAVPVAHLTASRVREFWESEAEFALALEDPLIVLCYRFGKVVPWSAALLEVPADHRLEPPTAGASEARALLCATLLDDTGEEAPKVSRNITLALGLTRVLDEAVRERARVSFDPHEHKRALTSLGRRYPTAKTLLPRAIERSFGSE
jgi:hypothetical protein